MSVEKLAYTYQEAAEVTGYGVWTLKQAVKAGDLKPTSPRIDGRRVEKATFFPEELRRWLANEPRNQ